jgi:hypothetical protein
MLVATCSHGIPWGGECRECNLAAARWLVEQWGAEIDEGRRVIAEAGKLEKHEVPDAA